MQNTSTWYEIRTKDISTRKSPTRDIRSPHVYETFARRHIYNSHANAVHKTCWTLPILNRNNIFENVTTLEYKEKIFDWKVRIEEQVAIGGLFVCISLYRRYYCCCSCCWSLFSFRCYMQSDFFLVADKTIVLVLRVLPSQGRFHHLTQLKKWNSRPKSKQTCWIDKVAVQFNKRSSIECTFQR